MIVLSPNCLCDDYGANSQPALQWRRSRGGSGDTCPPNFLSVGQRPLNLRLARLTFYTLLREVTTQNKYELVHSIVS